MEGFLGSLSLGALLALPWLFEFWAMQHQLPPEGDWSTWVVMGGRGAGKTRAGAEWVRSQVEGPTPEAPGACRRVALVAATLDQAREIMIEGESGLIACTPPDRRPKWIATRRMLVWPNGAEARIFSAADPESLRGPQFDCAWSDELAKWKKGRETWDMLQFGLRLGETPRHVVTTTPRVNPLLEDILKDAHTVQTAAPTRANPHLARSFLRVIEESYRGTFLGQQEIEGEMCDAIPGALWTRAGLGGMRSEAPELTRIVVAVDPPVTGGKSADACGIVVAGVQADGPPRDWRAWVLEDASVTGAHPSVWAAAAVAAARRWNADRVVAEVNQGGDLVENILRQVDPLLPYRAVRAARGKVARAEPVAALYEQGRVRHAGIFAALEAEMCALGPEGYSGRGSPDRVDALVWAITDLMIVPAGSYQAPRLRAL
ncbi:ATP-binding protein [Paroceanicella profunda]|uniref:ATP-binding protein n=1 Tax=Paroceanicella profunda TaxID=2579971 RepID=A0A5B8FXX5_9RHOB|nr:terminase family protein [Paroceanicella profunda]QDL93756.1 ATP-binding protein [Paroceanicella profunda]